MKERREGSKDDHLSGKNFFEKDECEGNVMVRKNIKAVVAFVAVLVVWKSAQEKERKT